ncbi:hypothetical protein Plhal304r1_c054g0139101 [Plasmopara halstedii]
MEKAFFLITKAVGGLEAIVALDEKITVQGRVKVASREILQCNRAGHMKR